MMLCCEVDDLKVAAAHSKTRLVPLINYVKVNLRHYSVISCSEAQDAQPFISVRTLPGTCSRCASSCLQSPDQSGLGFSFQTTRPRTGGYNFGLRQSPGRKYGRGFGPSFESLVLVWVLVSKLWLRSTSSLAHCWSALYLTVRRVAFGARWPA